jgi:nucleosome binding factor SPN SPT16 subunit
MELEINVERFYQRLERLQTEWLANKTGSWGGADAICIPFGSVGDELAYSKSATSHLYLIGYEDFTDSIILIAKNAFYFMASSKKCNFLEKQFADKPGPFSLHFLERTKDEGMTRENFNQLMGAVRKNGGKKMGSLFKEKFNGSFIPQWMDFVDQSQIEKIDITAALGLFFAVKDETEQV